MKKMISRLLISLAVLLGVLVISALLFFQFGIFHPKDLGPVEIHLLKEVPATLLSHEFKVMDYNVQYFAGKDYVFFYDVDDFSGPDVRPSTEAIEHTLDQIASLILEQNPDVVLLQEVDDHAKRTDYKNQTEQLLSRLENRYPYYAETYYWKAVFVPHPKIAGSVGMKLTTLSKAPILKALRHQLPRIQENPLTKAFNFKRAVLETHIQMQDGSIMVCLNTHLDAFAHSSDTMLKQVQKVDSILDNLAAQNLPWVIGGDFNLLPPGIKDRLPTYVGKSFSNDSEITLLYNKYQAFPSFEDLKSTDLTPKLTHFPNDPTVHAPDRIIDYYFYSNRLEFLSPSKVLQGPTLSYSDHLPLLATFRFKTSKQG